MMAEFPEAPLFAPPRTVESAWIDYNGHMNVACYSLVFDESLDVILDRAFGIGPEYAAQAGCGPYVVQCHMHYLAELFEGQSVQVRLRLMDADRKRLHVFMEMTREGSEEPVATSEQLLLHVDLRLRKSAPFPEDRLRRVLALRNAHARLPRPQQAGRGLGIRPSGGAG